MSAYGIVSRVTPVHTAVRNCTRDEGRPFEVGNQVLISSHRKLLSSKAMQADSIYDAAGTYDCRPCPLKPKCCPKTPHILLPPKNCARQVEIRFFT
jgi:hypothetical protein